MLDPYPTTPVGPLGTVNPFWSASLQQAAKGEPHVRAAASARGPHPAPSPGLGDVERLRERILKEAEETFAREVKKMTLSPRCRAPMPKDGVNSQGSLRNMEDHLTLLLVLLLITMLEVVEKV